MEEVEETGVVKIKKGVLGLIIVFLVFVGVLAFVLLDLNKTESIDESEIDSEEKGESENSKEPPEENIPQDQDEPEDQNEPEEEEGGQDEVDSSTYESCISNTEDSPGCKDCCDCLDTDDGAVRTACRDECAVHDFSENSDFITIDVPSSLGESGDYSECVALGGEQECKSCCEGSMGLQCGDYRHCRTACNEVFG